MVEKKTAFVVSTDDLSSNNIFTLIGSLVVLCCLIYCCISATSSLASIMSNFESRRPLHIHCTSSSQCPSGQICNTSTSICQNSVRNVTVKKTVVVPRPSYGYNYGYYY